MPSAVNFQSHECKPETLTRIFKVQNGEYNVIQSKCLTESGISSAYQFQFKQVCFFNIKNQFLLNSLLNSNE